MTTARKSGVSKAPKTVEKPAANSNAALEKQVASLVAKLASLEKELADLKNAVESQPAPVAAAPVSSGSGRDEDLRSELRKWIKTLSNPKIPTYKPSV